MILIGAVFEIEIFIFRIPSEKNIMVDTASHHDFKNLTNLGFQISELHQKSQARFKDIDLAPQLYIFLRTLSPPQSGRTMTPLAPPTKRTFDITDIPLSLPPVESIIHWLASVTRTVKSAITEGYLKALWSVHIERSLDISIFDDPVIKMIIGSAKLV